MKFGRKKKENKESVPEASQDAEKIVQVVRMATDGDRAESSQTVNILPGTKAIDLKESQRLKPSDGLIRASTGEVLSNNADLYALLADGEKVAITPDTLIGY